MWHFIPLPPGYGPGQVHFSVSLPLGQLYDIEKDYGETNNLYNQHPEIVKRLTTLLDKYLAEGRSTPGKPVPPLPDERPGLRGPKGRGGVEENG